MEQNLGLVVWAINNNQASIYAGLLLAACVLVVYWFTDQINNIHRCPKCRHPKGLMRERNEGGLITWCHQCGYRNFKSRDESWL